MSGTSSPAPAVAPIEKRMSPPGDRTPRRSVIVRAMVAALAFGVVVVGSTYGLERIWLRVNQNKGEFIEGKPLSSWRKIDLPGIIKPPTVPAHAARLRDDEEIIGIVVDGKARAYRLEALLDPKQHIINDLIDDLPLTVAHCDVSDCTRVYAGRRGEQPLDVSQAGLWNSDMILKIHDVYYQHRTGEPSDSDTDSPPLPCRAYPFLRMPWKQWRDEHPQTDIYLGETKVRAD
jgi:hypothetical protein